MQLYCVHLQIASMASQIAYFDCTSRYECGMVIRIRCYLQLSKCTVAGPLLSVLKCVNSHPTVFLWQAQERAQRTVIFSKTKTLSISRLDSAWTFSRDSRQLWPLLPPRMCKFHILGACTKGVWILAHFGVTQMHCTVKTFFYSGSFSFFFHCNCLYAGCLQICPSKRRAARASRLGVHEALQLV